MTAEERRALDERLHRSAVTPECWGRSRLLRRLLLRGEMGNLEAVQQHPNHKPFSDYEREYNLWASCLFDEFDCWNWTRAVNADGYGKISRSSGEQQAHRLVWRFTRGHFAGDRLICHLCDNPGCIRPDHLFCGTQTDNMRDMASKGRTGIRIGTSNHKATLTESQVLRIREMYESTESGALIISREFGVSKSCIESIITRKTWKHL